MTNSHARTATADDVVNRLIDSDYPATALDALGWGMGPAQLGLDEAVDDAARAGLITIGQYGGKVTLSLTRAGRAHGAERVRRRAALALAAYRAFVDQTTAAHPHLAARDLTLTDDRTGAVMALWSLAEVDAWLTALGRGGVDAATVERTTDDGTAYRVVEWTLTHGIRPGMTLRITADTIPAETLPDLAIVTAGIAPRRY